MDGSGLGRAQRRSCLSIDSWRKEGKEHAGDRANNDDYPNSALLVADTLKGPVRGRVWVPAGRETITHSALKQGKGESARAKPKGTAATGPSKWG